MLLTGAAGFIGAAVAERLLAGGMRVIGVDNLDPYYSPALKRARLDRVSAAAERTRGRFDFLELDLGDRSAAARVFEAGPFECVIHLAAQAGVRYSIDNPHAYAAANLTGFLHVLEACRRQAESGAGAPPHLVYASSSSVYGASAEPVLAADQPADHPISLYAATKRANELMAHSYTHLYGLPCSGVRFFTVYGPWGRPDMAVWKFTERILRGEPIDVYGGGKMQRGFTYIDDAAEGVVRLAARPPAPDAVPPRSPDRGTGPFRTYNLGSREPVELMRLIKAIEAACGRPANKRFLPMQPGDVVSTAAETSSLEEVTDLVPVTPIEEGVAAFVDWYRDYNDVR
ncbi:NAD-dependent epimerase/dehydratase family protein [Alienimonas chondri]|uniref:UDP-N-acetylglucosamine 4-epimerase n=1 Tax=Alienimonas chondri TaxID=2681879 RepID=A0ABX1VE55_9PLAN|nr:NAD-dependent epimerase/dehydratase family protein [Alienimonas chondri]NNJ26383.1 UDP-N-acetylglucosamine 4-epimerase [Alienimonas chondri]